MAVWPSVRKEVQRKRRYSTEEFQEGALLSILYTLSAGPLTVKQLTHKTLLSTRSVRRQLKELASRGLIAKSVDRTWHQIVKLQVADPSTMIVGGPAAPPVALGGAMEGQRPDFPALSVPGANMAAASHFKVPAQLNTLGPLTLGPPKKCVITSGTGKPCEANTPLRYGGQAVCASCARLWRE